VGVDDAAAGGGRGGRVVKQLASLAWKEWHEARAFLWIALGIFVGLPLIGGLEDTVLNSHRFEIETTPWVQYFGGVLALFVAVAMTCRDFQGRLEDFWRSRPVGIARWLLVKYLVGLVVVMVSCTVPPAIEFFINGSLRNHETLALIFVLTFFWMVVYSVGFLAGCLVRRTAHAAMMTVAAILLFYFLIVIVPSTRWLNLAWIIQPFSAMQYWSVGPDDRMGWEFLYVMFVAPVLILSLTAVLISLIAVRRGWRIDSNRKMMYGVVAAAFLAVIASAGVQLGTNLPVLRVFDTPDHSRIMMLRCDGHSGFAITYTASDATYLDGGYTIDSHPVYEFRPLRLTSSGIEWDAPSMMPTINQIYNFQTWVPLHPEVQYAITTTDDRQGVFWYGLETQQLDRDYGWRPPEYLWKRSVRAPSEMMSYDADPTIYTWGKRLYVIGTHLAIFDITEPGNPQMISDVPFPYPYGFSMSNPDSDTIVLRLPPVPDLPARQRLEAALGGERNNYVALEGDILCRGIYGDFVAYRLVQLTDEKATFVQIAQYESTMLQRVFGPPNNSGLMLVNGFLYEGAEGSDRWFDARIRSNQVFNSRATIFDVRGANPLRIVGHFGVVGAQVVCPLPDGGALVGGDKLWLIGPPPRHDGD
jgi:hypothetical protein